MATTIQPPPAISPAGKRIGSSSGAGGPVDLPPNARALRSVEYAPPPSSTGMWVVLAAIGMSFAALTSALVVRRGGAADWRHISLPAVLYFNTFVLLLSSVTLEISRRRIAAYMRNPGSTTVDRDSWLYATLALGLIFVIGQWIAWTELRVRGLYLATNPTSSFFYVFTVGHALHLTGGLGGLLRVIHKLHNSTLRRSTLDATSRYWHFMDALWVYLLVLLWMKL
ncbi:MAG TPA: cytochrome c oxidase subunit 3 [Candidatus Sulfotelmatobacter sp.]|jgi:cytochrome c oxidase subunit 3